MNLRSFNSNEGRVIEGIPEGDRSNEEVIKMLGIAWDTKKDTIVMQTQAWSNKTVTKRSILGFMAWHFDPLRLIAPVLLQWKVFYQQLWKGLDWGKHVSGNYHRATSTDKGRS